MFAYSASRIDLVSDRGGDRYSIRRAAALIVGSSLTLWFGLFALASALV